MIRRLVETTTKGAGIIWWLSNAFEVGVKRTDVRTGKQTPKPLQIIIVCENWMKQQPSCEKNVGQTVT